jgi:hypothetical protein
MTLLRSAPVEKNEPIHRLCLDNLDKHPHGEFSATRHDTSAVRPHQVQRLAIRIHIYELGPQFSAALHNGPGTRLGAARWCRCAALGPHRLWQTRLRLGQSAVAHAGCVPCVRHDQAVSRSEAARCNNSRQAAHSIARTDFLPLAHPNARTRAHTHSHTPMPAHVHTHAHTHAQTQTAILLAEHIAHRTRARAGIHS